MQAQEKEVVEQGIRELLDGGDLDAAATMAVRSYGPQILAYLRAVLRDEEAASECFSRFGESLWKGIGKLRGASSVRTWSYALAWGAIRRIKRDPFRRRARRLQTSELSLLARVAEALTPKRAMPAGGTDVFGCGVILFEMLCGRLPFAVSERGRSDLEEGSRVDVSASLFSDRTVVGSSLCLEFQHL